MMKTDVDVDPDEFWYTAAKMTPAVAIRQMADFKLLLESPGGVPIWRCEAVEKQG